jgi:hypothetical protein
LSFVENFFHPNLPAAQSFFKSAEFGQRAKSSLLSPSDDKVAHRFLVTTTDSRDFGNGPPICPHRFGRAVSSRSSGCNITGLQVAGFAS